MGWLCKKCETSNDQAASQCEVCGAEKKPNSTRSDRAFVRTVLLIALVCVGRAGWVIRQYSMPPAAPPEASQTLGVSQASALSGAAMPRAPSSSPAVRIPAVRNSPARPKIEKQHAHANEVQVTGAQEEQTHHNHFQAEGSLVSDHGIPLFLETQTSGGFSPRRRAEIVVERLNRLAATHGLEAEHIVMHIERGIPTVFFFHPHQTGESGHVVATVTCSPM